MNMQTIMKVITRRGRPQRRNEAGPPVLGDGRQAAAECVAAAQRAFAKGEARATACEIDALRRVMAGDIPDVRGAPDGKAKKKAAKAVSEAVRGMQHAAAKMRVAWREAGRMGTWMPCHRLDWPARGSMALRRTSLSGE